MKYFLSAGLILFVSFLFAQNRVDTIHCGNIVAYGKIKKGEKEGLWKYENKVSHALVFTGNYHEGLKEGEWTCSNKKEQRIVHYKNNVLDGPLIVYKLGRIYCEGNYRNGLKEGEWKYYLIYPNQISALEYYANGLPVGEWQICSDYYDCYTGMMNAYGKNGYWVQTYPGQAEDPNNPGTFIIVEETGDSILYVNGKESGYHNFNHESGSREAGNYVGGKKEGIWMFRYDYYYEVVEYKNGLREGYDSIWSNNNNNNQLLYVIFYLHDTINGPQIEFQDAGLLSQGTLIPNPQYISPYHPTIQVPIDLSIDLIENGICDSSLYSLDYSSTNISPHNRDSLISLIKEKSLHPPIIPLETPFSYTPTARIGYWTIYWEDYGTKKEEGNYLPIVYDIFDWDSTNQKEDPDNPGTYILAPLKLNYSIYYKTGWWKYYNEQGVMIREERYDEKGELKETSLYTPIPSPPSVSTTTRTGHWNLYWETGKKKEEGDFLQTTLDSSQWDSTKKVEDPNNPGTYIPDPLKPGSLIYCKTGWWKYYNEQGTMIREELYNQNGVLVETKNYGK